ncbi:Snf7 family protein [Nitzschia inconspicua]|uniref:Snf7 family protein n=1 Tax=Nitzschia inconspicua TaxID=303405 RepID=A0A9K3L489_9STRA|nr:Snf7 family protein [Nitzschia inconspicua]
MGWKLFNNKNSNSSKRKTAPIEANISIAKLRENLAIQEKREEHLQLKIAKMAELAKLQLKKGDKRAALSTMKKRKLYEGELAKIDNVKLTLETQAIQLEGAAQNIHTFEAMKTGTGTMALIRKSMGVERVDDIMDDIREEMDLHREVDKAFAAPIDIMIDDDDLLAELDAFSENATIATSSPGSTVWSFGEAKNNSRPSAATSANKPQRSKIALFG